MTDCADQVILLSHVTILLEELNKTRCIDTLVNGFAPAKVLQEVKINKKGINTNCTYMYLSEI